MATIENVFYLPDQESFENLRSGTLPGVRKAKKAGDHGSLVIENGAMEFRGTKGTVSLTPVRGLSREGLTKVEYGEGANIRVAYFNDWTLIKPGLFGKFAFGKAKKLYENIERELGGVATSAAADQDLLEHRAKMRTLAASRARNRMWVGAAVMVVGTLITVITYSAASSNPGGGRYFVAWGAIVFGALAFIQGLVEWRKNRA